ncbi:hypothetical protein VX159_15530 [Dechloromonas sp. ZY10]|uniref:hypothetical protein n=1 Tax=Dechloromonas aquae TaxID=2664436 RepID=UPI003528EEC9
MNLRLLLPCLALLAFAATPAQAGEQPSEAAGKAALTVLGEINGTALACQQLAIVSRARNAVSTTAPKTRENGEIFEHATNTAFLAQGQGGRCPEAMQLVERLNAAESELARAFATQRP